MDNVRCTEHGILCFLKTGTRDGPNKGKSFYVCGANRGAPCGFTQPAAVPASHCLLHEDYMVELQALVAQESGGYRLFYRCMKSKADGKKWCGHVPWNATNYKQKASNAPEQNLGEKMEKHGRNPFKILNDDPKHDVWKQMSGDRKKNEEESSGQEENQTQNGAERKIQGENERKKSGGEERKKSGGEERKKSGGGERGAKAMSEPPVQAGAASKTWEEKVSFQTWREKELPAGVKVKKKLQENSDGKDIRPVHMDGDPHLQDGGKDPPETRGVRDASLQERLSGGGKENTIQHQEDKIPARDATAETAGVSSGHKESIASTESDPKERDTPRESEACDDDDDDDDVLFVSSQPAAEKQRISGGAKQRTITSFPGFSSQPETQKASALHAQLTAQLQQKKATLASVNLKALPDKGERLLKQVQDLEDAVGSLNLSPEAENGSGCSQDGAVRALSAPLNPFSKHGAAESGAVKPLAFHELPTSSFGLHAPERPLTSSQNYSSLYGVTPQWQNFYGGRMTEDRLIAVRNATSETIDHLHKSLESCPSPDSTAEDPRGLKVPLLLHQKQALAWLLWRETQKPQGGILADDMGLGKTLTMIALILIQKQKQQKEKEEEKKLESWISKTDSSLTVSRGTLIICPASLVHHWKKEVEKRVSDSRLRVYLYHGPNREKDCKALAQYDIVVTTYSLVSKEIPVKKEEGDAPAKDQDLEDKAAASSPLLRMAWARIILDEAHNIKNPKVQTSIAVCKLRAGARWAVTGTPIQNNLLDMYSLLRFLRCSPFDEFKLWKNQVDNGSKKGGERLNILTKSLLLRRTKDQLDHTGRPLVLLPQRRSELHRLKLSAQERSVYDVIFARSRSTLQNYLKKHEGGVREPARGAENPFERVAREFGGSQCDLPSSGPTQGSSTVHILSLLLRLRQCCCHPSLLRLTLDQTELKSEGVSLSLEEQLNALSLSELQSPDLKSTVSLNGTSFPAELFERESRSTKIDSLISELRTISSSSVPQKSVIVSQWTSMLKIVAVHLKNMGLSFATIDGSVNPKLRMDLVEDFNSDPRGPQVMLVSLCAGGVGLNLIGGNHLFLLDMHWNPALEDQACDRIYRVGQRKDVVIHRFVCVETVEEKITQLQEKKKDLANKVLSGNSSSFTKLTLADLRLLFGL
ncbi:transcription termination factor 2 [Spea bombifrons]|uniref:transcription termination factor 2 n=1 Tax=Spea bombifrons TaxID=233779 RepID=UPI002349C28F|nr:transcription termination factor 2 [Spea bombifrons]